MACQKLHQDTCDCYTRLMLAHADDQGDDRIDEAQLYISHELNCQDYENFFRKLTQDRMTKHLEHQSEKGYLQSPIKKYVKGTYNIKCCCQSHIVHRESDKFMIANEAPYNFKLTSNSIFEHLEDGEPEIYQKSFD